jgi:prepilin-type N-terminal cleavage/methylation domain-containing protein
MNKITRGFTLIELLVVIAIIGVLASIVLASLDSSRKKGRDARRLSDLKQIQLALELYYDANSAFPPGDGTTGGLTDAQLVVPGYISKIPTDPMSNAVYKYVPYMGSSDSGNNAICISYHLGAKLESSGHSQLLQDADITNSLSLGFRPCTKDGVGPANDFNGVTIGDNCAGTIGVKDTTELCYDVRP